MNVNQIKDFVERVGWTAIQSGAAAAIVALTSPDLTWQDGLKMVGIATAVAVLKVLAAQNVGATNDGAAIPGGVRG